MIAQELEDKLLSIFTKWNLDANVGKAVAQNMMYAHQYGHATHGVHLLRRYKQWLGFGTVNRTGTLDLLSDEHMYMFDAAKSFGHWAVPAALNLIKDKGKPFSMFTIKNLGHTGYIGGCLKYANLQNHLVLLFVNTSGSRLVRPYNGSNKMMSTSCIAASIPEIYNVDFTTATISENSVQYSLMNKESLQTPLILENNEFTYNPADLYADTQYGPNAIVSKTAMTFKDHKMFHLGILIEILAGIVSQSGTSANQSFHSGCFGIMLELGSNQLINIKKYIDWLKSSPNTSVSSNKYNSDITLQTWEKEILDKYYGE